DLTGRAVTVGCRRASNSSCEYTVAGPVRRSCQGRLGEPDVGVDVGDRRRQPVVLRPQPGDLELQCLYRGTQTGDLVQQTPVRRSSDVAVEGLRHLVSS